MKVIGCIAMLGLAGLATSTQAQMLQPGLWELTTSNMQVEGKAMPNMDQMLAQMRLLPPEQQAMMKQVLARQGISLGDTGIRSCLTAEQVKANDIPLQDPQSGCTQRITERKGNVWKFSFSCPKAQGEGTATFLSDREFTTEVAGTFNATGATQRGRMHTRALWLGANCGTVKPRQ
jgi:hypothetical protein